MTTKEYMPEVGEVCEAVWLDVSDGVSRNFVEIAYKGKDDRACWFKILTGDEEGDYEVELLSNITFRPLKTQQEIEREEAINDLTGAILSHWNDEGRDCVIHERRLAETLYKKGCRKVGDEVAPDEIIKFSDSTPFGIRTQLARELVDKYKIYPRGDVLPKR